MKIKDMKIGELYFPVSHMTFKHEKISQFEDHVYMKKGDKLIDWSGQKTRYPINSDYVTIGSGYYSDETRKPIVYLGSTIENWWLPRSDWFPIRKRHWCMHKGRKMILDAWSAKYLISIGEYSEQL